MLGQGPGEARRSSSQELITQSRLLFTEAASPAQIKCKAHVNCLNAASLSTMAWHQSPALGHKINSFHSFSDFLEEQKPLFTLWYFESGRAEQSNRRASGSGGGLAVVGERGQEVQARLWSLLGQNY